MLNRLLGKSANPYKNLSFAGHVDWRHVNPLLLQKLNVLARQKGVIIDVISGYRSNSYSTKVGGFAGDPHSRGIAVDAYVNGKPIGVVWSVSTFSKLGITSGNTPNFYKGSTDPEHVQLAGAGAYVAGNTPMTTGPGKPYVGNTGGSAPAATTGGTGAVAPSPYGPSSGDLVNADMQAAQQNPLEPQVGANVLQPNLGANVEPSPVGSPHAQTWQMIAAQPGASPDALRLAQLSQLGGA